MAAEDRSTWPEALATVLECRYDVRAGRALAFGLTSKKHFRITYNYWAGDTLQTGECFSEKAIPQGNLFPVHYDPDAPHRNHSPAVDAPARLPLIAIGAAGSVLLLLAALFLLHGC